MGFLGNTQETSLAADRIVIGQLPAGVKVTLVSHQHIPAGAVLVTIERKWWFSPVIIASRIGDTVYISKDADPRIPAQPGSSETRVTAGRRELQRTRWVSTHVTIRVPPGCRLTVW